MGKTNLLQMLNTLGSIYQTIIKRRSEIHDPEDLEMLFQDVCDRFIGDDLFQMVWIGLINPYDDRVQESICQSGMSNSYISIYEKSDSPHKLTHSTKELNYDIIGNDIVLSFPILWENKIHGTLNIHASDTCELLIDTSDNNECLDLIKCIALDLGSIINNLEELERKETNSRIIRSNEERFRLIAASSADSVWDWNIQTDNLWWTEGFVTVFEDPLHMKHERTWDWFTDQLHPEDREPVLRSIYKAIRGKQVSWDHEFRFKSNYLQDNYVWVYSRGCILRGDGDTAIRMTGSLQDISESKKLQQDLKDSETRWQFALEGNRDGLWDWNVSEGHIYLSPRWKEILCFEDDELPNELEEWNSRIHHDDYESFLSKRKSTLIGENKFYVSEHRVLCKDGTYRWVLDRGKVMQRDLEGMPVRMVGTQTDITERKKTELKLITNTQVIENSGEGILVVDTNNSFTMVNKAFSEITGYDQQEVIGKNFSLMYIHNDRNKYREMLNTIIETGKWSGELICKKKNGVQFPIWININTVYDEFGSPSSRIGIFSDITEQKTQLEKIEFLAKFDSLTSLPNRFHIKERFNEMISNHRKQDSCIAVLFLDLDRFKTVNDTLGHTTGDELLKAVASRLTKYLRKNDIVARMGGDEFVILIEAPLADHQQVIRKISNTIVNEISEPFNIDGRILNTTTSIGVSIYPNDSSSFEELIKNADTAMYKAKESGKNAVHFFSKDLQESLEEIVYIENQLRQSMNRNEWELWYQPQWDLKSEKIIGAEALIRWRHPEMGLIPPNRFIPVAEESGLIINIGDWVIYEACRQNKTWQELGLPAVPIAVNVSGIQFRQKDFKQKLKNILNRTKLEPHYLELELTESVLMHDATSVIDAVNDLRGSGLLMSIDDFGTGYSSLAYLKKFPIDKLKIDQSFIRNLLESNEDTEIVRTILALAKSMNLTVIAEGVETEEHMVRLKELGCKEGQGYWFSKPLPAKEFQELLQKNPESYFEIIKK